MILSRYACRESATITERRSLTCCDVIFQSCLQQCKTTPNGHWSSKTSFYMQRHALSKQLLLFSLPEPRANSIIIITLFICKKCFPISQCIGKAIQSQPNVLLLGPTKLFPLLYIKLCDLSVCEQLSPSPMCWKCITKHSKSRAFRQQYCKSCMNCPDSLCSIRL